MSGGPTDPGEKAGIAPNGNRNENRMHFAAGRASRPAGRSVRLGVWRTKVKRNY